MRTGKGEAALQASRHVKVGKEKVVGMRPNRRFTPYERALKADVAPASELVSGRPTRRAGHAERWAAGIPGLGPNGSPSIERPKIQVQLQNW